MDNITGRVKVQTQKTRIWGQALTLDILVHLPYTFPLTWIIYELSRLNPVYE
jgi:hypothetical protein